MGQEEQGVVGANAFDTEDTEYLNETVSEMGSIAISLTTAKCTVTMN